MFFHHLHRIPRLEPLINKTKKKVFKDLEEMLMLIKSLLSGLISVIHYSLLFWTDVLNYSWYTADILFDHITSSLKISTLEINTEHADFQSVFLARHFLVWSSPNGCDCLILDMFLLIILCNYFNFRSPTL